MGRHLQARLAASFVVGCDHCRRGEIRLRAQLREAIGTTPVIQGDETKLTQVFVNLLGERGAGHAGHHSLPERDRARSCTDPVGRAVIEIHDTGCGHSATSSRLASSIRSSRRSPSVWGRGLGLFVSLQLSSPRGPRRIHHVRVRGWSRHDLQSVVARLPPSHSERRSARGVSHRETPRRAPTRTRRARRRSVEMSCVVFQTATVVSCRMRARYGARARSRPARRATDAYSLTLESADRG